MKKLFVLLSSFLFLVGCGQKVNKETPKDFEPVITGDSNVLVAYFSVTNNTKKLAGYAKEHLDCDIFEIVPTNPYTSQDIDYNSDCRANREQNDNNARPEIKFTIDDIFQYDTIVLGYPIWWGQAPKIMYTFIESFDFTNKTILPFCTSGSSPIGSSATNLAKSAPTAKWLEGRRFAASTNKETIGNWLDEYFKKDVEMKLFIDNKELDVTWEDNNSVSDLKKKLPITINMNEYGGFEQTGSIGQSIIRNDKQMNVVPGDIVLYNGNAISVFYNKSSWPYTKLGHINMSDAELKTLLNKSSVTFELKGF